MSGYRCTATTEAHLSIQVLAQAIRSPHDVIGWAPDTILQCLLEDVPHDVHVAFLRSGARVNSDLFLRWSDGLHEQSLVDLECCLATRAPRGAACTIYARHPGLCDWAYIDPAAVAADAQADQLLKEMGL